MLTASSQNGTKIAGSISNGDSYMTSALFGVYQSEEKGLENNF